MCGRWVVLGVGELLLDLLLGVVVGVLEEGRQVGGGVWGLVRHWIRICRLHCARRGCGVCNGMNRERVLLLGVAVALAGTVHCHCEVLDGLLVGEFVGGIGRGHCEEGVVGESGVGRSGVLWWEEIGICCVKGRLVFVYRNHRHTVSHALTIKSI